MSSLSPSASSEGSLSELARAKLVKVLGPERGRRVYEDTLRALSLEAISSPDLLYAFSEHLVAKGGIEAAVGALLGVAAVIRGADGKPSPVHEVGSGGLAGAVTAGLPPRR